MRPWNHAVIFVEFDSIREGVTAARSSFVTARMKMLMMMMVMMMMVVVVVLWWWMVLMTMMMVIISQGSAGWDSR